MDLAKIDHFLSNFFVRSRKMVKKTHINLFVKSLALGMEDVEEGEMEKYYCS